MVPITPVDSSMNLVHHFLERSARLYPDKVALIHGPVRATYAEINNRADALAAYLISIGLQRGDRVALLMENCLEYVISYYGILKSGGVAVPLNSDLKVDGLRYAINDLEARILISGGRFEKLITASNLADLGVTHLIMHKAQRSGHTDAPSAAMGNAGESPAADGQKPSPSGPVSFAVIDFGPVSSSPSADLVPSEITDRDVASIIYTSGSTGGPKGVILSHRNIVDNTFSICQYLHLSDKDIQMVVLPFFYVMGKSLLNTHFAVGGTVVINNQFAYPASILKEMVREKVTGFSGVPSTFAYLVHRSPLAGMRDQLVSLRYVSQAGGHMARAIKERLRESLPAHTEIVIMYGATEAAARLSFLDPSRFPDKMDSIGKAVPGVTLLVLKEDGNTAAVGEVGELVARGSNMMQGYWKNPEATKKVYVDGWYHTGDQAYTDEEGFIFLVGRKDDLLKVGGHRLNPQEIEDAILSSGMFVEAVVLGIPDELLGNRLVTLGVPANGDCTSSDVLGFCAKALPRFKVPSEVRFVRALPKKASGKIDRTACREIYGQVV